MKELLVENFFERVKKETGISRDKVYRHEKSKTKSDNNLKQDQTGTEGVSHFCHLAKMRHLENQGENPKQNPAENFFSSMIRPV